jgi:hypothetical protein
MLAEQLKPSPYPLAMKPWPTRDSPTCWMISLCSTVLNSGWCWYLKPACQGGIAHHWVLNEGMHFMHKPFVVS